jgi:hypothetical protein
MKLFSILFCGDSFRYISGRIAAETREDACNIGSMLAGFDLSPIGKAGENVILDYMGEMSGRKTSGIVELVKRHPYKRLKRKGGNG